MKKILAKAAHGLKDKDFVLGPALDGGYYLLRMRHYESIVFENVNWGSSSVFAETVDRIRKSGASLEVLETVSDIDDWESLKHEKNRIDRDIRKIWVSNDSGYRPGKRRLLILVYRSQLHAVDHSVAGENIGHDNDLVASK